jgi:hypothetical protein
MSVRFSESTRERPESTRGRVVGIAYQRPGVTVFFGNNGRSGNDSGEGRRGRAAVGFRAQTALASSGTDDAVRVDLNERSRGAGVNGGEREGRGSRCGRGIGIIGAVRWSGEGRCCPVPLLDCRIPGHGAVVGAMAAAASGQKRLGAGREYGRERPQPEEQNQKCADDSPHLQPMLHAHMPNEKQDVVSG